MERITNDKIVMLEDDEIFVFGSNLAGRHGKGAALLAKNKFGAEYGNGLGMQGNCYAIPTKGFELEVLPIQGIKPFVDIFIAHATEHKESKFMVTEIGCGLAGYSPEEIAPLFKKATELKNVWLPANFWNNLKNSNGKL